MEPWRGPSGVPGTVIIAAGHEGDGSTNRPVSAVRWGRARSVAFALGLGVLTAVFTAVYIFAADDGPSSVLAFLPFILPAAIIGVAPPAYVALDLGRRNRRLQAAAAFSVTALVAFVVFWTAALAATPGPVAVRMAPQTIVLARRYERAEWFKRPAERDHMVEDLITSGRLKGLSATQVLTELGTPTKVQLRKGLRTLCYRIGVIGGRTEWLDVCCGADGKVSRTVVMR